MSYQHSYPTFRAMYDAMKGRVKVGYGVYVQMDTAGGRACCVMGQIYCTAYEMEHEELPFATFSHFTHIEPVISKAMDIPHPDYFNWELETQAGHMSCEQAFDEGVLTADEIIQILDERLLRWRKKYGQS